MSKLLYNAYRFSSANSARIERGNGANNVGALTADGRYGFDCSGFVDYVARNSGYQIGAYTNTSAAINSDGTLKPAGAAWQKTVAAAEVRKGDLVYFSGHVGFVVSFDASTGVGIFRSSTTSYGVTDAPFTTSPANGKTYWGTGGKNFVGFTRIDAPHSDVKDIWASSPSTSAFGTPPLHASPALPTQANPNPSGYANSWWTQTAWIESRGVLKAYDAENGNALGKYQMKETQSLVALEYTDSRGRWLGKNGINSRADFLANGAEQEKAAVAYVGILRQELIRNGAMAYVGKTIDGHLITEEGLLGAAWEGAGRVKQLLAVLNDPTSSDNIGKLYLLSRMDSFRGTLAPGMAGANVSGSTTSIPVQSTGSIGNLPYPSAGAATHHSDGGVTYEYVVKVDSPNGQYKKGDLVSISYDKEPVNGVNFDSETIWRADDTVYQRSLSADKTKETIVEWNKSNVKTRQITKDVATGQPEGEFIKDGQWYDATGNPIMSADFVGPPPPNVNPNTLLDAISAPLPTKDGSAQQAAADWSGANFGLAEFNPSGLFADTQLGYLPGAQVNTADALEAELIARGYEVTRDDNGISASKGEQHLSFTGEGMIFQNGNQWASLSVEKNGIVISGSHLGDKEREMRVVIGGKNTILRGQFLGDGDDLGDVPTDAFGVDQVVSIGGQSFGALGTGAYGLNDDDFASYGLTFSNLVSGDIPIAAVNLIGGMDPAAIQSNGWASPQLTITSLGDGLTQRSIVLGNGTTLSSVRNEDDSLLNVRHLQQFANGSFIDARTNYNSDNTQTVTSEAKLYDTLASFVSHSHTSTVTNIVGVQTHKLEVTYNAQGGITHTRLTELQPNGTHAVTVRDGVGDTVSTGTWQIFDDGSTLEVINPAGGGRSILRATDRTDQVRDADLMVATAGQTEQQRQSDLQDALYADVSGFFGALRAKDKLGTLLYGAKIVIDLQMSGDQSPSLQGMNTGLSGVIGALGVFSALRGLQSDDPLTVIGSAVGMLNSANAVFASMNGGVGFITNGSAAFKLLGQIGAILSIANLANLGDMLDNGQYGSAALTTVNAINGAAFLASGGGYTATGAGAFIPMDLTTLIIFIVVVIVIDGMAEEDEAEAPPPPPPFGEAVFKRLEDGSLSFEIVDAGHGGGEILAAKMDELIAKLNQQVAEANSDNTDPDQALALIASRMPKISLQSWPSKYTNLINNYFFVLEQTHPQTGAALLSGISRLDIVEHFAESLVLPEAIASQWQVNHLTAKFGTDERNWKTEGQWLSALSPIEQQRVSLQETLAGASAVLEEVKVQRFKFDEWTASGGVTEDGSPMFLEPIPIDEVAVSAAEAATAAATVALKAFESQHPADPQVAAHIVDPSITDPALRAAAFENATRQWLKVIAVDLGDDGVTQVALPNVVKNDYESLQTDGVARFDADNDGFREATEWIAPSEAMLGIDRDGNGLIDTASELFNGVSSPFDQRGLASLKYYDSNNDGKIDALDPVFKLLRLWIDLNGDGSAGSMETYDMQMRHPGVDMAALRARLDAAQQVAMDALANSAVTSIDLNTFKLRMADGTDAQASQVELQAHTEGIAVMVDQPTQNVSILHENGLRENYITLVQDMSLLLELQSTSISTARRTELEALALRYGLNTQSADFISVVKSLRTGGESLGASGMSVYIGTDDVWADPNVRQRLEQMRFSFHGAASVGGADVYGTATFSAPVWAGASTDTPAFNDQWALNHHVTTGEVTSDTAVAAPPPPPNPEQWVLPTDVYTLDYVVKGAQLGGLVTQQAVIASNAATPGAPAQTIQVYTTASPTSSLAAATIAGWEDQKFAFGYEQLEQEARTLIADGTPYTTVRLLGVRAVSHGYVEVDDVSGRIRFIADANYSGTEAGFSYAIMDGQGQVMERRINFNLAEVNDAPTLLGETIDAREDVPLLLDAATLLANDSDLEGDTLTIIGIGRVGMGRAELLDNGQISYRPPTDLYDVTDTIEYIVQDARGGSAVAVVKIRLTGVNDAPTVVSEVIRNAKEDTNLRIDAALLLANDFDPDFNAQAGAAPLSISAVGNGVHGQAFLDSSGQIIFVPDDNFNGTATFEYTVTDDTGLSTTGKAEVEVGAANDGPRAFGEVIDSYEDQKLVIEAGLLLANDEDIDVQRGEQQRLRVVAVDQAVNGVVSLEEGRVVFTPASNFSGEASFRYTIGDGAGGFSLAVAKINIAAVNDGPTLFNRGFQGTEETPINITVEQLLAGVVDIEDGANGIQFVSAGNATGGTLERTGDTFTFTPGANFNSVAQFDYTVQDAQGTASTAVVTMSFNNVNDAPVFVAGSHLVKAGLEDQELRISVAALKQMFVDVDGDTISVDTANLTAVNTDDTIRYDSVTQEVVFKAKANANGIRQFDVRVQDSNGLYSAYERLNVNLLAMNDTPIVNSVGFEVLEDGGYTAGHLQAWSYLSYSNLLSGSSDADGDVLTIVNAANGRTLDGRSVSIVNDAANNRVGILAPLNYNGAFTFDFTVGDAQGAQSTQKAYGNVVAVNDLATASAVYLHAGTFAYYRLDVVDVEDGSNVAITVDRNPLWGPAVQGYTDQWEWVPPPPHEELTHMQLGTWVMKRTEETSNYVGVPYATTGSGGPDSATFHLTDTQGGVGSYVLNFLVGQALPPPPFDPIVIDMDGDGLNFLDISESNILVDRDGDGTMEHLAWVDASEGILAWDHNQDNQINQVDEIAFWSHVNPLDPWRTDLQSLARPEFDTNQDGKFDNADAKWSEFKLWRDLNSNGVSDVGELQTLTEAGLKSLYLHANVLNRRYGEDVLVRGYTRAEMTDGRMLQAGDVQLGIKDAAATPPPAPTAGQQQAQIISVADAQALAAQQQQAQAAASRIGSPEFSGALRDQKVLTGQAYSYVLPEALFSNLGAGTQYSVKLASGQPLPAWLHFDAATRTLSGVPTQGQVGTWNVKVVGTDAGGAVSAGVMALSVAEFNQAPVEYGHVPTQHADEDQLFSLDIAPNFFIDKDAGDQLRFSATLANGSALPSWLQFDAQTMRFYGTPGGSHAGAFEVKLTALDEANAAAHTFFKIVVSGTNDAPYLVGPVPTIGLTAGIANTFVFPQNLFADHDLGDVLQLSVTVADGSALPSWLVYDAATQTLSAQPTAEQISAPLQLRVSATDLAGATTSTLMTAAAVVNGTDGNDVLTGSAYGEYIWGQAGNDTLDGQAGADRLIGGLGNDGYVVDALDLVVERSNEGTDTVYSTGNWTLGENLENLSLTGNAAVNATGNHLANVLSGNSAANTLAGEGGDDTYLFGFGSGQDTLVEIEQAGASNDIVQFSANVSVSDVWVSADAEYVYLNLLDGTDRLAIRRLAGGDMGVESIRFADGTSWDHAAVMARVVPNAAPLSVAASHVRVSVEDQLFEDASPGAWFSTASPGLSYWARLGNGDALPAWLSLNAATGTFSGLPQNADVAAFDIRLYARDTYGAVSSTLVQFSVLNTNDAPTASPMQSQQAATSQEFVYVVPANVFADMDVGDALTLEATRSNGAPLPSWLAFDAATRTFSGTPPTDADETLTIAIKATDSSGASAATGFSLAIGNGLAGSVGAETLTGTAGRDLIYGLAGNDILNGGAGNDLLNGGEGADALYGGAGNDTYFVDDGGDTVVETTSTTINVDQGHYSTTYVDHGQYYYASAYDGNGNPISYSAFQVYDESGNPMYTPVWFPHVVASTTWVSNMVAQTTVSDSGGVDTVNASVAFTLGANQENLTLTGSDAINGTGNALNNVLTGNSASNVLTGAAGEDTLDGGAGDDVLVGGLNNDRYLFGHGYGQDTVSDTDTTAGNSDTVVMQAGILASDVVVSRTAAHMVLTLGSSNDKVLIDWDVANGKRIECVEFADGTVWTANDLLVMSNRAPTYTTTPADQSTAEDALWSYTLPADTFADLDGGDVLSYSASLADDSALPGWLSFNAATRTFSGAPLNANVGNLVLKVKATDTLGAMASGTFNVLVTNTNDAPTVLVSLAGQQANETQAFSYVLPTGIFGDVDAGDSLTLSVVLANGSALPSWLSFDAATRTLAGTPPDTAAGILSLAVRATDTAGAFVQTALSVDITNTISGTAAAETLIGTAGKDLLDGGEGADALYGGAGNDTYFVDNAGDTVVETTSTTTYTDQGYYSTTYVDQGYWAYNESSGHHWVSNMVAQTSWVSNMVAQTTVSDTGGVDTVNASVAFALGANQESLTLIGSSAINGTGNALNNVLAGNSAANVLSGGAGNDTYLLGRGSNTDTVQENDSTAGNTDAVKFLSSVAADQVWFRQVNNDLEASIVGTDDKFVLANWYLGAQHRVEQFKTTDGDKTLLASQVQNLVSAMAAFAPPAAGETTLPASYATTLAPVIAANWQ